MMRILSKRILGVLCVAGLALAGGLQRGFAEDWWAQAPPPFKPTPTKQQLDWQSWEMELFVDFGLQTFTGDPKETGSEDPKLFAPKTVDCRQWARVAKESGFKSIVLTAKYYDGFCLWPTKTTDRSVKACPWQGGKGDVVRDLAEACKAYGLKFGLACAARDLSQPGYTGDPAEYMKLYQQQITELLTNYGTVAEIWFDGTESSKLPDWPALIAMARKLQPQIVIKQGPIFKQNLGEDIRFGTASSTGSVWSVIPAPEARANDSRTPFWFPVQGRTPIVKNIKRNNKSIFWIEGEVPMSSEDLLDLYYKHAGNNMGFMLTIPVAPTGQFSEATVASLKGLHEALDKIFKKDLTQAKPITATNVRVGNAKYSPEMANDGDPTTYWATDDNVTQASLEVRLLGEKEFNVIRLEEMISLGQRVQEYNVEVYDAKSQAWTTVANGTTIGYRKLDRIPLVKASRVRLNITKALACPTIKSFGIHLDPVSKAVETAAASDE